MNKVILLGRLARDPEVRYTQNKIMSVRFSIAVDKRFKRENEERQADFFNCVAFGRTAEFISNYFGKGQKILLFGYLSTVSAINSETGKQYTLVNVVVDEAYFADGKKKADESTQIPEEGFVPITDAEGMPF